MFFQIILKCSIQFLYNQNLSGNPPSLVKLRNLPFGEECRNQTSTPAFPGRVTLRGPSVVSRRDSSEHEFSRSSGITGVFLHAVAFELLYSQMVLLPAFSQLFPLVYIWMCFRFSSCSPSGPMPISNYLDKKGN